MAIYSVDGATLSSAFSKDESTVVKAYDITGVEIFDGSSPSGDHMDWSDMTATYKANVQSVVSYAQSYLNSHDNSYAFPVLTDVHDKLYNEPNFVLYNYPDFFDKFLFLGDIANSFSQTQMDNAVAYMQEADDIDILALVGNHEFGNWTEGNTLPKVWYSPLLPESCVIMSDDGLVYYYDDTINNVRFICLDSCTPIYAQSGVQKLTKNQLEFFASALDTSGTKDIILLNHAIGQSYYYVTDTAKETAISTTGITNRTMMDAIINAYVNRTSYTLSDDSSVSHTHDYSSMTGSFIGYITGHTHHAGYNNANGYNAFTCPSSYYNSDAGMSVFIIDKDSNKMIWLIGYRSKSAYEAYEYTY